jgi:hypothetical protein
MSRFFPATIWPGSCCRPVGGTEGVFVFTCLLNYLGTSCCPRIMVINMNGLPHPEENDLEKGEKDHS